MKQTIIAHKTNSIDAIRHAFAKNADGIEIDVHLSVDNKVVVYHSSFNEEKKLLETNKSNNVLLLETILQQKIIPDNKRLIIDVKSPGFNIIDEIVALLRKYKMLDTEIFSNDSSQIYYLYLHFPDIDRGLYIRPNFFESWMTNEYLFHLFIEYNNNLKLSFLHLPLHVCSTALITHLHENNVSISCNIANKDMIEKALGIECKQLTTDFLEETIQKNQ